RDPSRQNDGVDLAGGNRANHVRDSFKGGQLYLIQIEAHLVSKQSGHEVERRAPLGHAKLPARQIFGAAQSVFPGLIGGEVSREFETRLLAALRPDNLQRSVPGEVIEAGGKSGYPEICVTRSDGHGHWLRGAKELEGDVQPFLVIVAAFLGNEKR